MITIKNFDSWKTYEGAYEGSGRSEKIWLISADGNIGLFKFPKIDPSTAQETTEHVSEHLAHQLGEILNVSTAAVDIGTYHGRIGSMSYLVTSAHEYLIEGIGFISGIYPNYDAEKMIDASEHKFYCLEHIFRSTDKFICKNVWIEMMIFDFLIGNADRHQSNWALLASFPETDAEEIGIRKCPFYDNGSSLCCYVNEEQVKKMFGKDPGPFNALVDSKSRSIIRIDGSSKALPRHKEVVRYLLQQYIDTTYDICKRFLDKLDNKKIDALLDIYPTEILSPEKNKLIRRFLKQKLSILNELLKGGN